MKHPTRQYGALCFALTLTLTLSCGDGDGEVEGDGDGDVDGDGEAEDDIDAEADVESDADAEAEGDAEADADTDGDRERDSDIDESADAGGDAPSVTSVSGSGAAGSAIVIRGSNFGHKDPAAPLLYETFDDGRDGEPLATDTDWPAHMSTGATYSSTSPYGGSGLCAYNYTEYGDRSSEGFRTNYYLFPEQDTIYYSYMSRHTGTDANEGVYKNGRINSQSNSYSSDIMLALSDNYVFYRTDGSSTYPEGRHFSAVDIGSSEWQRHELYDRLSNPPGAENGEIFVRVHSENKRYENIVTRAAGYDLQFTSIILGLMHDPPNLPPGAYHHMYVDDVYVDNTQARVELCSGSTWQHRGQCVPQIPTAWTDGEISATVNQGAFSAGSVVYLYVVDAEGHANSSGHEVTID